MSSPILTPDDNDDNLENKGDGEAARKLPNPRSKYKLMLCDWSSQKKLSFLSLFCPCCVYGSIVANFRTKSRARLSSLLYAVLILFTIFKGAIEICPFLDDFRKF